MKTENKNFIYNFLYQIFIFIIPLITTPYISRVLGVDNIGIYSYTYSIVYYFMLATMLGINNYGSRTVAKYSKDKKTLSERFCSIYYLQLIIGIIMFIIYNLIVHFALPEEYRMISTLQNIFLFSAILDVNWLFFGLEKFKITISRNIVIKLLSFILIFVFVKDENDLFIYTIIMGASNLVSQLYLWLFIKKDINFVKVSFKKIFSNLKGCLILFIPVIAYSIYRVMDKTMLGAISGTTDLGFYENAEKIINIPVSILTALGTVMLPNMTKTTEDTIFYKKLYSSFELCFFLILPMVFGLFVIGENFSVIFFGEGYEASGRIIQVLIWSVLFSSIANIIRTNYLIPKEEDGIYVKSTILGAIINFVFNMILIPKYSFYGACVGTILAEFFVMFYQIIYTRREIDYKVVGKLFLKYFFKTIVVIIFISIIGIFIDNNILKLVIQIFVAIILYAILNKNYILYDFFSIKRRKSI